MAVERLRDAPYENVKQRMVSRSPESWTLDPHLQLTCWHLRIPQLSGDLSDCAAKSLLERYSKDTKNAAYIDFTMRSSLGSVYVGKCANVSALWLLLTDVTSGRRG